MPDTIPVNDLMPSLITAALRAGAAVMAVYARDFAVDYKDDASPLTEADERSHAIIRDALRAADPSLPQLSEEGAAIPFGERVGWDRYALIDPLDGTKEFVRRNGEFTVNIAIMEANQTDADRFAEPVAGVVYAPVPRLLYWGVVGRGAWRADVEPAAQTDTASVMKTGVPLPASVGAIPGASAARPYTIVASRSHMNGETEAFVDARREVHPDLNLINAGSSLKLCRVAEGSADEYPRFAPTMEWDTAAGDAVARAAGCRVVRWIVDSATGSGAPGAALEYNKEDLHNPWFLVVHEDDA